MSLITEHPPDAGIDAGVIEEARERQRRRWKRAVSGGVVFAGAVAGLLFALVGGGSNATGGSSPFALSRPPVLTFHDSVPYVNGQPFAISVAPTLTAGSVALDASALNHGHGGSGYPTSTNPVIGSFDDSRYLRGRLVAGGIYATLVGPTVASMRVTGRGTFKPHPAVGLPLGEKVFIFSRPLGSAGNVIAPWSGKGPKTALVETFYTASGHRVTTAPARGFKVPSAYWQAPAAPSTSGNCGLRTTLSGVKAQGGEVATAIAPDRTASGPAFLSCLSTWYSWHHASFDVGLLLNAESPGSPPAPLWDSRALPGHPGVVEINATQEHIKLPRLSMTVSAAFLALVTQRLGKTGASRYVKRYEQRAQRLNREFPQGRVRVIVLSPAAVARRVDNAWLIVRDGDNLAQRIAFLDALRITRLNTN